MARRLRERREAAGLTGPEVHARGGPKKSYLSQLETGKATPNTWPLLCTLARIYSTSTDYLLGLTDDPAPVTVARDMPYYGADMLAILRELPEWWQQIVTRQAEIVRDTYTQELERRELSEFVRSIVPANLYEEILRGYYALIDAGDTEAALQYFKAAVGPWLATAAGTETTNETD